MPPSMTATTAEKPAEGYLSDDPMPSGRKRGYLKYFSCSAGSMDVGRFGKFARIAFSKGSPRPREQLVQTTMLGHVSTAAGDRNGKHEETATEDRQAHR